VYRVHVGVECTGCMLVVKCTGCMLVVAEVLTIYKVLSMVSRDRAMSAY
jgi:hypothetical protein